MCRTRSRKAGAPASPAKSLVVEHNYHDHAADAPDHSEDEAGLHTRSSFLKTLYDLLDNAESQGINHIISWQPHGRCFILKDHQALQPILSAHFNVSKVSSFQRQLNLYGFLRLTRGIDRGGYYHEHFLRGKFFLAKNITRVKVKGTKVRARSNPKTEPNFWAMQWVSETITKAPSQCGIRNSVHEKVATTTAANCFSPHATEIQCSSQMPGYSSASSGVMATPKFCRSFQVRSSMPTLGPMTPFDSAWCFEGKPPATQGTLETGHASDPPESNLELMSIVTSPSLNLSDAADDFLASQDPLLELFF